MLMMMSFDAEYNLFNVRDVLDEQAMVREKSYSV